MAERGKVGFANAGNSCYLSAALQMLLQVPNLCNYGSHLHSAFAQFLTELYTAKHHPTTRSIIEAPRLIAWVQKYLPDHVHYQGVEEDSHEMLIAVLDAMERHGGKARVEELMYGTRLYVTTCQACFNGSTREEPFMQLDVPFSTNDPVRIETYFADSFRTELFEGDNKYQCDRCNQLQVATRIVCISRFPQFLLMQVLRFDANIKKFNPFIFAHRVSGKKPGNPIYQLQSLIVHEGPTKNTGHYVAYGVIDMDTNRPSQSRWVKYNDTRCTDVQTDDLATEEIARNVYVLLFKLTGVVPDGDLKLTPDAGLETTKKNV